MRALPGNFDAVELAQLESRLIALKARSAALCSDVSRSRWLLLAPLFALAALLAYGALGQIRLHSVEVRQLVVLDDAGSPGIVLGADNDGGKLHLTHAGTAALSLESTTTSRRLMVFPRGPVSGFGANLSCTPYTTDTALNQLGGRDDLFGLLSLSAHVSASLTVQAEGSGYASLSSSIEYGAQTSLQLLQLSGANLELGVGSVPKIRLHQTSENQIELSLFQSPVLQVGGTLAPSVRVDTSGSLLVDVPDVGNVSLFGSLSSGPILILTDEKSASSVHLGERVTVSHGDASTSLPGVVVR